MDRALTLKFMQSLFQPFFCRFVNRCHGMTGIHSNKLETPHTAAVLPVCLTRTSSLPSSSSSSSRGCGFPLELHVVAPEVEAVVVDVDGLDGSSSERKTASVKSK